MCGYSDWCRFSSLRLVKKKEKKQQRKRKKKVVCACALFSLKIDWLINWLLEVQQTITIISGLIPLKKKKKKREKKRKNLTKEIGEEWWFYFNTVPTDVSCSLICLSVADAVTTDVFTPDCSFAVDLPALLKPYRIYSEISTGQPHVFHKPLEIAVLVFVVALRQHECFANSWSEK